MELISGIIGLVGTIIGTFIGFFLSEKAIKSRLGEEEKGLISSTRKILRIEINRNLKYIEIFLSEVEKNEKRHNIDFHGKLNALKETILPQWNNELWRSQLAQVAKALTDDEIDTLIDIYDKFDHLSIIYNELQGRISDPDRSKTLYKEFFELAQLILAKGNPIQN